MNAFVAFGGVLALTIRAIARGFMVLASPTLVSVQCASISHRFEGHTSDRSIDLMSTETLLLRLWVLLANDCCTYWLDRRRAEVAPPFCPDRPRMEGLKVRLNTAYRLLFCRWGDVGQPLACLDQAGADARRDNEHCAGIQPTTTSDRRITPTGDRRLG